MTKTDNVLAATFGVLLVLVLAFVIVYLITWGTVSTLAAFDVKASFWGVFGAWFVLGWIGKTLRGDKE